MTHLSTRSKSWFVIIAFPRIKAFCTQFVIRPKQIYEMADIQDSYIFTMFAYWNMNTF